MDKLMLSKKIRERIIRNFICIIPDEEIYFVRLEVPNVRINSDVIKINYGSLSPFKDGDFIFYKDKNWLYIWFTKNKLNLRKVNIPEGYLAAKKHLKSKGDVIVITRKKKNVFSVVVVKDGSILTHFIRHGIDDLFLDFLKKEYSLENTEVEKIDKLNFDVDIKDIFRFAKPLEMNEKLHFDSVYEEIKKTLIIFLILINVFNFSLYEYVSKIENNKRSKLLELKKANKVIKDKFDYLEKEKQFFDKFAANELKYPNLYKLLYVITYNVAQNDGLILKYEQSYNNIRLSVRADSISSIVSNLMTTGYFHRIQILNISQYNKDKTKEVGVLKLVLKNIKR